MNKHTPTPWIVQTDNKGFYWIDHLLIDGGESVCNVGTSLNAKATAKFIICACNNHDELLEACKKTVSYLDFSNLNRQDLSKEIKQAIAKAEGTTRGK